MDEQMFEPGLRTEGPEQEIEEIELFHLFPISRPSAGEELDPRQLERRGSYLTGTSLYPAPLGGERSELKVSISDCV